MDQVNPEVLAGVSIDELEALAAGVLVPKVQARLDQLLADAKNSRLSSDEQAGLDNLLHQNVLARSSSGIGVAGSKHYVDVGTLLSGLTRT